jgi:NAD(P)-dependent dehydrogenase (short-subunit alcohol dehydrogenase family)
MTHRVVVTGAGRGLGAAFVDLLVDRGWTVWATDIDDEKLATSRAHRKIVMDVTDHGMVQNVLAQVDAAGGLDGLVNNAAIMPHCDWKSQDTPMWRNLFEVNVLGAWVCAQTAANYMAERGRGGSIVNLGSLTFYSGPANGIAYAASKGAVLAMTRALASAVGPFGVRVNCVAPGLTRTPGNLELVENGQLAPDRLGDQDAERPLPGATQPQAIAKAVAFLLGEDASDITGQILPVDGGSTYV